MGKKRKISFSGIFRGIVLCSLFSCGKAPKNSSNNGSIKQEALGTSQIILTTEYGDNTIYTIESNGLFYIPSGAEKSQETDNYYKAKLTFNLDSNSEEIYCLYQSQSTPNSSPFQGCYYDIGLDNEDSNDQFLNYKPGELISQDKNSIMQFEIIESENEQKLKAQMILDVDWH